MRLSAGRIRTRYIFDEAIYVYMTTADASSRFKNRLEASVFTITLRACDVSPGDDMSYRFRYSVETGNSK